MRPETDPLISPITEPPTDLVFCDENPLSDCRLRIPKATITELHANANEYRESIELQYAVPRMRSRRLPHPPNCYLMRLAHQRFPLKNENKRLTEENDNLKSSLQLETDERAKERAEFEEILMDKQRTIDYKDKSLV